ncbi:hypothetical protein Dalk_3505 [Desulfatibacillum aliphaticivorans]|uniref:Uncharacterized protein n=1 Tax=Desulfatibacillum aliphaticivorans TaxID=218208 RepID=B8FBY8_DESAL|nr:hypothetical protein [Desulfatibacillum aliphaticivorans]ACL05193.1 hypothetical protein Dalk_3505 [Desulfatibacillum aliphaticivorans]
MTMVEGCISRWAGRLGMIKGVKAVVCNKCGHSKAYFIECRKIIPFRAYGEDNLLVFQTKQAGPWYKNLLFFSDLIFTDNNSVEFLRMNDDWVTYGDKKYPLNINYRKKYSLFETEEFEYCLVNNPEPTALFRTVEDYLITGIACCSRLYQEKVYRYYSS